MLTRLVSLAPSNTELLAFLGLADRLVGVDDWSDWPPEVEGLERLGPDLQIDLDRVERLKPDLALASLSVPGMERVVQGLEERGIPHMTLAPKSLGDIARDCVAVGGALGAPARAMRLSAAIDREVSRIRSLTRRSPPARVYWEWWPKPLITAGGPSWMTEVIQAAGGANVFAARNEESPQVDLAEIVAARPEVMAACWCGTLQRVQGLERVRERPGWAKLAPLVGERIMLMREDLYGRPGPRIVEGLRQLALLLHPGLGRESGPPYAWLPDDLKTSVPLSPAVE